METMDLQKIQGSLDDLKDQMAQLKASLPEDKLSMVVFSGDLDKLLAAFIIATGATAMFEKVTMFFTFWGIPAMRDPKKKEPAKGLMAKMFGWMLPKGPEKLALSKMHMGGMGTEMIKGIMKQHNAKSLEELIQAAAEGGVEIFICQMSMELMGFTIEEMRDYPNLKVAGVAKFLQEAGSSKSTLFI